jgi:hypothetical protein
MWVDGGARKSEVSHGFRAGVSGVTISKKYSGQIHHKQCAIFIIIVN